MTVALMQSVDVLGGVHVRSRVAATTYLGFSRVDRSGELNRNGPRPRVVKGVVRDASGTPQAGVRVVLLRRTDGATEASTTTDDEGVYVFQVLGPKRGYMTVAEASDGATGVSSPDLEPESEFPDFDFGVLDPGLPAI